MRNRYLRVFSVISLTALVASVGWAQGPCDILATGGTPCVAAYSTTRALLAAYSGPLYQVRRASDGLTKDVGPISVGGVANAAVQDTFCTGTTCTISEIYDQSGKSNHLTRSLGGGQVCVHKDLEAVADALPLVLGVHKVYGIQVVSDNNGACTPPAGGEGTGYRLDKTNGIATGDAAETEYFLTSGDYQSYQNSGCCFDYGNVETNDEDDGAATMEAINFGGGAGWGHGGGSGPWVLADMENGIFSGSTSAYTGNTSVPYHYVTAGLIGRSGGTYALLAGNAQTGPLVTMYDGARPSGYTTMKKQGAIVLGTGGDNSDHGRGYFFEGAMTTGAATIATMGLVHANIVAAGYGGLLGSDSLVSFYKLINFDSLEVSLPVGSYSRALLLAMGGQDNSITSIKVPPGFQVDLFDADNFQTSLGTFTSDQSNLGAVGSKTTSLRISKASTIVQGHSGSSVRTVRWSDGTLYIEGPSSGRVELVDAHGRLRILEVSGGKGDALRLPTGVYWVRDPDAPEDVQSISIVR